MGQKKTWALHHVPFSQLWETISHNTAFSWNSILQNKLTAKFSSAAPDFYTPSSSFFHIWKSDYLNSVKTLTQNSIFKKRAKQGFTWKKKATLTFIWTVNANKGTNETTATKTYLVKTNGIVCLIHYFFRPLFEEQKKQIQYKNPDNEIQTKKVSKNVLPNLVDHRVAIKWPQNSRINKTAITTQIKTPITFINVFKEFVIEPEVQAAYQARVTKNHTQSTQNPMSELFGAYLLDREYQLYAKI